MVVFLAIPFAADAGATASPAVRRTGWQPVACDVAFVLGGTLVGGFVSVARCVLPRLDLARLRRARYGETTRRPPPHV